MDKNISIIITARNNGKYLAEAIESCLNQTVKPFEIIYSDDFSTDDSLEIAQRYPIKVIVHEKHLGVVDARNDGVRKSAGNVLVFMDGDDIFPKDFIERHLQTFDESTPFVYCAAQAFGIVNTFWWVLPWKCQFLWNRNFINTSAMMWKWAFEKAGRWKETSLNTMWDWSIGIRLSRLGVPKKSPAVLLYRQHMESWSRANEKGEYYNNFQGMTETIRREMVNVTVGMIYSGRIDGFLDKWMNTLVGDVSILSNKPELIIINNSETSINLKKYNKYFSIIKIIDGRGKLTWKDEVDRRNKVCEMLSDQYNMIIENSTGELIHMREDDIIPNKDSFKKIYEFITRGNPVNNAVAGIYLNRNPNYKRVIGGFYNEEEPQKTADILGSPTREPFQIDFTGTGFLMFWKDICPTFSPYIDRIQAHDWAWGMKLKRSGGSLWMIPEAICKHYCNMNEYVIYDKSMDITPSTTFTKQVNGKVTPKQTTIVKPCLNFAN